MPGLPAGFVGWSCRNVALVAAVGALSAVVAGCTAPPPPPLSARPVRPGAPVSGGGELG